ncbi:pyridoxamine 5-phosphate oxidase [Rhodobacter sp. HX-7-19]|uniref:Pyridoxamine 5-phosphate oxidase n=1 Tax=Paragemmobacter kunshanensis TaxID=2583234 RepID=A0A6M1U027_9RHOB|nr:pyridoxamine 5'-phosphate oxidase family protein [Rhodobacter kunshanensis]NGQ92256.1 pyridoxamine 5-phosphate oxidase [Rhodobacter kunshanensis]
MTKRTDPVAAADEAARRQARDLLAGAGFAALSWRDPEDGTPGISRIAFGLAPDRGMVTLVSALAPHFAALQAHPDCAIMVGEVGDKADPLTHPRLMIKARAAFVPLDDPERADLRAHWLRHHPKAKLYVDFADFAFVRFIPRSALLNAGFARAYRMTPEDLA